MPRVPRIVAMDYPHHITQRSNFNRTVFETRGDYITYLKWFEEYKQKYKLDILAYCLMPNHVHFIAIPRLENALSKTYSCCHKRYSLWFNLKKGVTGNLWQNRFYSCILDDKHLFASIRYIENNPVASRLVAKPQEWEFSSASQHLYDIKGYISLSDIKQFLDIKNWQEYLKEKDDKQLIDNIKKNTLTGKPIGDFEFLDKLKRKTPLNCT